MGLLHSKALTRLWMRRAGSLWHIFGKSAHALSPIFGKSARALSPIFGKSARALSKKVRGQDALSKCPCSNERSLCLSRPFIVSTYLSVK